VADNRQRIIEEFDEAVNMTPGELEDWLQTEESKSVSQSDGGRESKGHESVRKIVETFGKNKSDYTDDDIDHMGVSWAMSSATRPRSRRATWRTPLGAAL
jgi:hypothetical protein